MPQIAHNKQINKPLLLELIHSKESKGVSVYLLSSLNCGQERLQPNAWQQKLNKHGQLTQIETQ